MSQNQTRRHPREREASRYRPISVNSQKPNVGRSWNSARYRIRRGRTQKLYHQTLHDANAAAKRVLRYLKGTSQAKIRSPSRGSEPTSAIAGYTDSDWANDRVSRRIRFPRMEQPGFVVIQAEAYRPIHYRSRIYRLLGGYSGPPVAPTAQ